MLLTVDNRVSSDDQFAGHVELAKRTGNKRNQKT